MAAATTTEKEQPEMSTKVMRVPEIVHEEAVQLAALRREQPAQLLAEAWQDYMDKHREEFATDLERAAKELRDGTLESLSAFASRNAKSRAQASVRRLKTRSET